MVTVADEFGALINIVDGGDSPTSSSSSPSDSDDDSDFMTSSDGVSVINLGSTSTEDTSSDDDDEVSLVDSDDDSEASGDGGGMTGGGTSTRGRSARRKARQDAENDGNGGGLLREGQKGHRARQPPRRGLRRGQSGSSGYELGTGRIKGGRGGRTRKGRGAKKASEEEDEDAKEAQEGAHVRPPGLRLRPRPVVRYGEEESSDEAGRGPVRAARARMPSAGVGGGDAVVRRGGSRIRVTATAAASHEAPRTRQGRSSYLHQRDPSYSQRGLRDYNGRLERGDSEVEDHDAGGLEGCNDDAADAGGARPSRQSLRLRCVRVEP